MIIEGPYDTSRPETLGVVVVRDYESNPNVAWQVDMSFAEAAACLGTHRGDRSRRFVHADIDTLKNQGRLGKSSTCPEYEFEIFSLSQIPELEQDPRYRNARGFQGDITGDCYKDFQTMHRDAKMWMFATVGFKELELAYDL